MSHGYRVYTRGRLFMYIFMQDYNIFYVGIGHDRRTCKQNIFWGGGFKPSPGTKENIHLYTQFTIFKPFVHKQIVLKVLKLFQGRGE